MLLQRYRRSTFKLLLVIGLCNFSGLNAGAETSPAGQTDGWIRPDGSANARPIWGIIGGISVGLWPTAGPRGLIRIYTPYLEQQPGQIEQFIAVEPIVAGHRDLSEMQKSGSDGKAGKPMWSTDDFDLLNPPCLTTTPARGTVHRNGNIQTLSLFINVERFDNGARPIIKLILNNNQPHEVTLQTYAAADSARMESCVLTATMGNWSRLRHLHLQNRTVNSTDLFQHASRDGWQFFPWHEFSDLSATGGETTFAATGELDTNTPDAVPAAWRYHGIVARQSWTTKSCAGLVGRVNGRFTFWGTQVEIPGGASYENFELKSAYAMGQTFHFSVNAETN